MSKKAFNIPSSLYPEALVLAAIDAFEGYDIIYADGSIIIDDENPELVFDELMNYTLSLFSENIIGA